MLKINEGFNLEDGRVLNAREMDMVTKFYYAACTQEYLADNYTNDEQTLWTLALETREVQSECEANGNPITENEAIEIASNSLNITLDEQ